MKTSDAIAYFDGNKSRLARALGLEPPSVYDWGEFPPPLRQKQLEELTEGALKAEVDCFKTEKKARQPELSPAVEAAADRASACDDARLIGAACLLAGDPRDDREVYIAPTRRTSDKPGASNRERHGG